MNDRDDNFLSRWSRRKAQVRVGVVPADDAAPAAPAAASAAVQPATVQPQPAATAIASRAPGAAPPPAPTLADVATLSPQSDYTRFVAQGVAPQVKNAALKKLFTDPHFNLMDGLDTYIDDYGKPDPLPPGMLRKLAQSRLMGLFDDEHPAADEAVAAPDPVPSPAPPAEAAPEPAPPAAADGAAAH